MLNRFGLGCCCCKITYAYTLLGCDSLPLAGVPVVASRPGQADISAVTDASGRASVTVPSAGWSVAPQPGPRYGLPAASGVSGSATCGHTLSATLTYPPGAWTAGHGPTPIDSAGYYCVPSCAVPIPPTLTLTSPLGTCTMPQRSGGGSPPVGVWGFYGDRGPGLFSLPFGRLAGNTTGTTLKYYPPPAGPAYYCGDPAEVNASEFYTLSAKPTGWQLFKSWFVCVGANADGTVTAGVASPPVGDGDPNVGAAALVSVSATAPYGCSPLALTFGFTQGISAGAVTVSEAPGQ